MIKNETQTDKKGLKGSVETLKQGAPNCAKKVEVPAPVSAKRKLSWTAAVKAKETREADIERVFCAQVRTRGGWAVKMESSIRGLPDRMVMLPGGKVIFVELKSDSGKVSFYQARIHQRMQALGFDVRVIRGLSGVAEFFRELDTDSVGKVLRRWGFPGL